MPSDLFGEITHRPPTTRFSRRTVALATIAAHTLIFIGALFFSLSSPGLLPTPRTALAFIDTSRHVQLVDIQRPAPTRAAATNDNHRVAIEADAPAPPRDAAPLLPPDGVAPDVDAAAPLSARTPEIQAIESRSAAGASFSGVGRNITPAAPTAAAQTPVRLHSGILQPVKRVDVTPTYPPLAQSARVQGVVILEAVIDAAGQVTSVQVLRSIPLLDQAAINAVRQWRYSPAMLNGSPMPVIMTVTVNFKL